MRRSARSQWSVTAPSAVGRRLRLRLQPAGQIRSFASFRAAVDRVPPAVSRGLLVGFVGVGSLNFVFVRSDDPVVQQLAATVKPVQ